jgi:inhibitor of KinA
MEPRIIALGDRALILELPSRVDDVAPARIHQVCSWLSDGRLPGVTELVSAATTVTVFYDVIALKKSGAPKHDLAGWLSTRLKERLTLLPDAAAQHPARLIEIPVCYGGSFGPDLEGIATRTKRSMEEIIALHSAAEYVVLQLGFAPGFPYLHGLPESLRFPRRETPRTRVAAGSVAIANGQSCIYPAEIPGGWHVLGRTPLRLFDPDCSSPALLQPGDRVKFRPISLHEFERLEETP